MEKQLLLTSKDKKLLCTILGKSKKSKTGSTLQGKFINAIYNKHAYILTKINLIHYFITIYTMTEPSTARNILSTESINNGNKG